MTVNFGIPIRLLLQDFVLDTEIWEVLFVFVRFCFTVLMRSSIASDSLGQSIYCLNVVCLKRPRLANSCRPSSPKVVIVPGLIVVSLLGMFPCTRFQFLLC